MYAIACSLIRGVTQGTAPHQPPRSTGRDRDGCALSGMWMMQSSVRRKKAAQVGRFGDDRATFYLQTPLSSALAPAGFSHLLDAHTLSRLHACPAGSGA
ncbi:MAG: hypothetical protein H7836_12180, partial [Magnetococcus sp. YQC-3]